MIKFGMRFLAISKVAILLSALLLTRSVFAAGLLFDGGFESGTLQGWNASGSKGGMGTVVAQSTCYSSNDTTQLQIEGNYAALIRSSPSGATDSIGALTSDLFTAGDGIAFLALSESNDKAGNNPVNFEVHITDNSGETLVAHKIRTSVVRLENGCPSSGRNGTFYAHYVDTRDFLGSSIRVQFRQYTLHEGLGFFTLIDNVVKFEQGEMPIFSSKPRAVAGVSQTDNGVLRLDGSFSLDPDDAPLPLSYSWYIDGESTPRFGEYSCIDDLSEGEHTVTLYVSDSVNTDSDTMKFVVIHEENLTPEGSFDNPFDPTQQNNSATSNIIIEIDGCDEPSREVESDESS